MLYLHIPFCKKACHYCNFHFSTSLRQKDILLDAICKELELQQSFLPSPELSSVYFGGGTPSILAVADIVRIFETIERFYTILPDAEITLEANPDDMSADWLQDLKQYTPVNRLSIGIQSFHDADLTWMNRAHQAKEGRSAIEQALKTGFNNLTIDLIYGSPMTDNAAWAENLSIAFSYPIPHFSAYCLTVEEGTALHHFVKKGQSPPVDEDRAVAHLEHLMAASKTAGFEHYEISNFALPGMHARHNSNYWMGAPYLGAGPAAHSYNGKIRQWNIANNSLYIKSLSEGSLNFEKEELTEEQIFNEYILTMLRTKWGCNTDRCEEILPGGAARLIQQSTPFLASGQMEEYEKGFFRLTEKGKFLAEKNGISKIF